MADELADPGYGDATRRHARRGELLDVVESRTRTRTTADLLAALGEAGVPCAPINDYGQVFTDEHLTARGFFWDAPHPTLGPVRQIGSPMRLSRTPAVRGVAGPPLGADTRAALTRAGLPADLVDAVAPTTAGEQA
jgi:formyl-CoA transferase